MLLALSSLHHHEQVKTRNPRCRHDEGWTLLAMRDFLTNGQFTDASREFAVRAYNSSLANAGKTLFIDKTPRYHHILPWLDELFPRAGKIWLKRDPLDVAASYLTTWGITPEQLTGDPLIPASYDLTTGLKRLADHADASPGILEVRYEDLVADPCRVTEEVCSFLKVAYQTGMVDYADGGDVVTRQQRLLGDKKLYQHSKPHASSIGRWKTVLKPSGVQRLVDFIGGEMFERMGYPETVARLRNMGIRFPSAAELEDRHAGLLRDTPGSPVHAIDGAIKFARRYENEARQRKFPPWFLTLEGLRARRIRKQLASAKAGLARLRKQTGGQ